MLTGWEWLTSHANWMGVVNITWEWLTLHDANWMGVANITCLLDGSGYIICLLDGSG